MRRFVVLCLPVVFSLAIVISGCGGGNGAGSFAPKQNPTPTPTPNTANEWTWISGSTSDTTTPVYGSLGVASGTNVPGSRFGSVRWTDSSGNLWLFGGNGMGYSSNGISFISGELNDLWEFNPTAKSWTWVSGSNTSSGSGGPVTLGVYGTQGIASTSNCPGARDSAVSWTDNNGNLWLFGGSGYDSVGNMGFLNDLWKFSPATKEWTWVSGSNIADGYGPVSPNVPAARMEAVGLTDSSGNFWLFGGNGYLSGLNDVWEFNPTAKIWTLVRDSDGPNATPVYGQKGVASASNVPPGLVGAVGWIDGNDNLWLYGGDAQNDLWEFNTTTKEWTWVSGGGGGNERVAAVYGTQGVGSPNNTPGGLSNAVGWSDASGNLWLFGGYYQDKWSLSLVPFNALWKFNIATNQWTWMGGYPGNNGRGIYGTLGLASANNFPGARMEAVGWTDKSGNFWLFGGNGYGNQDSQSSAERLNDLWRYQP